MEVTGKLEKFRILEGWFSALEIMIDGERYYKRRGSGQSMYRILLRSQQCKGQLVRIEYEDIKLDFLDYLTERVFCVTFGVPRRYKEIKTIRPVRR